MLSVGLLAVNEVLSGCEVHWPRHVHCAHSIHSVVKALRPLIQDSPDWHCAVKKKGTGIAPICQSAIDLKEGNPGPCSS